MNDIFLLNARHLIRIGILIIVGIPALKWLSRLFLSICSPRFSHHSCILLDRIIFYTGLICIGVAVMHEFGFNVTALLGAAGIFGVAIGFASQTSISNIISGFFLVLERPFSIGDVIKVGDITGVVESIDLLSVRVCTLDNKFVRVPNETILKQHLTTLTYYDTKRIDCILSVPYTQDLAHTKKLIFDIIKSNPLFLKTPSPTVTMQRIGQHDYDTEIRTFLSIRVWVTKNDFSSAPPVLMQELKNQFDKNDCIITISQTNQ
jgi:small-conductance mechanosensitive channel